MVLVLNVGSQTFKWKLFDQFGTVLKQQEGENDRESCLELLRGENEIKLVAHRLVHGGPKYFDPIELTGPIIKYLDQIAYLAPLHNPPALATVREVSKLAPTAKHVAVFDTGFFKKLPLYAKLYAVPYEWFSKYNIQRFGFHGISHQYAAESAAVILHKPLKSLRLITVHLGAGCSIAAISAGKAIETSMGYTPLEGLVMSTRSGDLDSAIFLHLHKRHNLSLEQIDTALHTKSGLLGISGATGDMKKLLTRSDERSLLALDMFVYRIRKYIGAYIAILGGVDAIIMTGAIGSGSEYIRNRVSSGLDIFGDFKFLTVPTDEEAMIFKQCRKFLKATR